MNLLNTIVTYVINAYYKGKSNAATPREGL